MTEIVAGSLVLGVVIASLWRVAMRRGVRGFPLVAVVTLPLGLLAVVGLFVWIKSEVQWNWSACRLAPALGLLQGFPLYSPPDHGPINDWNYGPVSALCWLPAAWGKTPITALAIAESLNLLWLIAPLFAVCLLAGGKDLPGRALAAWSGIAAAAALVWYDSTWYMASVLTVDNVAVGLGIFACLLVRPRPLIW